MNNAKMPNGNGSEAMRQQPADSCGRVMAVHAVRPREAASGWTWRDCGALVLLLIMLLCGCGSPSALSGQTIDVRIADRTFELEIAADDPARFQGLSDREHIPADGGMLFVYPRETTLTFVMRRCLVPIDLLFLDADGRVVRMHAMTVEPYDTPEADLARYSSAPYPAQFAIEVAGGTIRELGVTAGEKIALPLDDLKRLAK